MKTCVHERLNPSQNEAVVQRFDVVVVGGGMSGLCAAISSARTGARTAIVQDRSVFGGNASSEIRMHVLGASCHWQKEDAAETGIVMELQLENKMLNDSYNYSIWDGVLWSVAKKESNLTIFLNTTMEKVISDGKRISAIECYQMSTENRYRLEASIFVDSTGLGTLSAFSGAEYWIGTEDKTEYGEMNAPDVKNGDTMGNTVLFIAEDKGHPVKFTKPDWAYTFDESDFIHRYHGDVTVYLTPTECVVLPKGTPYHGGKDFLVEKYDIKSGYWWLELGGDWDDIIKQAEDIRWELYKTVYGIWDHIKNGGEHGAENYELTWVGNIPGIRESRRIVGDYVLTENDVLSNKVFDDAVAYGGWPMDVHVAGGFRAKGKIPSMVRSFPGFYSIPYGCYVAKHLDNLMMTGRIISASKLAMGSTRVMGTCSVGGQAVGTAAAMAVRYGETPREFGKNHIQELRQQLLKDDCYIPGAVNNDPMDIARRSKVRATSEKAPAVNVINGVSRNVDGKINAWISDGISSEGEALVMDFGKECSIKQVRLTFDPNLSEERAISIAKSFTDRERKGVAPELVKDFVLIGRKRGSEVFRQDVCDNWRRHCIIDLDGPVSVDELEIRVLSTNGDVDARIFEVRVY